MSNSGSGTMIREIGRIIAGGYADHQGVRKSTMNRIRDVVRHKNEGIPYGQREDKKEQRNFDSKYSDKNLPRFIEEMFVKGKLTEEERDYLRKALELGNKAASLEQSHKGPMRNFISQEIVWGKFLCHIPGIGEVLAANLFAKFGNCERYEHVSSLWRHCGLHLVCPQCTEKLNGQVFPVVADITGKCPQCNSVGISPKRRKGQKIDFDSRRRSFVWNIAKSLVKQKSPVYYDLYLREKNRQLQRVFPQGELKKLYDDPYKKEDTALKLGHADSRALRKMIKIFLQHYWVVSRQFTKLPVSNPYVQDKLDHKDIVTWEDALRANSVERGSKPFGE